jgi:hypothetical protein
MHFFRERRRNFNTDGPPIKTITAMHSQLTSEQLNVVKNLYLIVGLAVFGSGQ